MIAAIREKGKIPAISVKPKTPAQAVYPYLDKVGMVLVMTVEPGFGGQSFMADMLPKIKALRQKAEELSLDLDIQVDGGIDLNTAPLVAAAGANVLVAGSSVFGSGDPAAMVKSCAKRQGPPMAGTCNQTGYVRCTSLGFFVPGRQSKRYVPYRPIFIMASSSARSWPCSAA